MTSPTFELCTMQISSQVFPSSRSKRECVICRFEGRYASEKTVFCSHHRVPLCTKVHGETPLQSYMCPEPNKTCWDKYHTFYFPSGLFNTQGRIRTSSRLYKMKNEIEARSRTPALATIAEENDSTTQVPSFLERLNATTVQDSTQVPSTTQLQDTSNTISDQDKAKSSDVVMYNISL